MAIDFYEIWEKGTPLNEAWLLWATECNREKYSAEPERPDFQNIRNKTLIERVRVAQSVLGNFKRPFDLQRLMRKDLVQWLIDEDFYAFGFPVKPSTGKTPRIISCEFWINAKIDWENEIAGEVDRKFKLIRIVDPEEFPEIEYRPKIGRSTHKLLIYEAITEYLKDTPEFQYNSHKEKADQIRGYIFSKYKELNAKSPGLTDDTIRKIVNSFFQEKFKE